MAAAWTSHTMAAACVENTNKEISNGGGQVPSMYIYKAVIFLLRALTYPTLAQNEKNYYVLGNFIFISTPCRTPQCCKINEVSFNLKKKLDDSAFFRTQSYITEICYFKFLLI